jgi:hypothetical protein
MKKVKLAALKHHDEQYHTIFYLSHEDASLGFGAKDSS